MTKTIQTTKSTEEAVKDFLKTLLEKEKVCGVFTLKKITSKAVAYTLVTDPAELDDAVPLYPLMPVNAGKLLSRFSLKGSSKKPVIAVVKPCELRGFVELIKREQGSIDNLFIMSFTCGGVFPTSTEVDGTAEKQLGSYWETVKKGMVNKDVRPTCQSCEEFIPYTADITLEVLGKTDIDKQCIMHITSKKGELLFEDNKNKFIEKDLDTKKLDTIRKQRSQEKEKLYEQLDKKLTNIDGLIEIFSKCLSCHGCSKVCPICYCKLCEFESADAEYGPSQYDSELKKRGGLRVPPGTIYFQLGRLSHISISCVACGACDDVCPVDIPVAMIFKKIGESVQQMFDYVPGKDYDEPIPLVTFENEEFSEIEE